MDYSLKKLGEPFQVLPLCPGKVTINIILVAFPSKKWFEIHLFVSVIKKALTQNQNKLTTRVPVTVARQIKWIN